jgi:hypothetical protein
MFIDLEIKENELLKFSFTKPTDFEKSCSEWNINYPSLAMAPDFEYYLAVQINTLIKDLSIDSIYLALLDLRIPINARLRISLTKTSDYWHFDLNLINSKVTIPMHENVNSNTYCD